MCVILTTIYFSYSNKIMILTVLRSHDFLVDLVVIIFIVTGFLINNLYILWFSSVDREYQLVT